MIRQEISQTLDDLAAEDFTQRAHTFLNILGYKSERTLKTDGTLGALIPKNISLTKKESEALKHWQEGHLLFQITDGEIKEGLGQASLLKETFDKGREKSFVFISVELEEKTYTRSQIANMVRGLNKAFQMPAVIIFRYGKRATLGVIHQREHKKDENKNVLEKVTLIKDISLENPNRAHIDILAELSLPELVNKYQVRNFDNLLKAWETTLDISELNKRFYKDLVEWFHKACTEVKFPSSKDNPIKPEEHVIRMICRLLFIWFIKEKSLVAEELFDESGMKTLLEKWDKNKGENYYTAILQNLFFATLNTEVDKRAFSKKGQATHRNPNFYRYKDQLKDQDEFLKIIGKTPFINGGLFDCLDSFDATGEGGYRIDCFTDNNNHRKELSVPNRLFFGEDGLFKLFTRYKFTVEENTPIERDVALDPELLGLTFEDLLAESDSETEKTVRKQTGSYYTPRQIVDYMVDEALTAALAAKVEPYDDDPAWLKDRLRDLLDYGSGGKENKGHLIEEQETKPLIKAMSRLKVLDPAVGSGAFPMGILNKLVLALEKLDPENKIWKEMQIVYAQQESGKAYQTIDKGETREARLREINETFEQFSGDFGRKLYLIQNSIFGVDIQTVACQIAKLRVFISLAVEQVGNQKAKENYGIRPLPNLETRFVAANSLIGLHQGQLSLARTPKVNEIEQQIKRISDLYFNARTRKKKQEYKQSDTKLRKALVNELAANGDLSADEVKQIADWSPYDQNSTAAWFDPEWMFGVQEGFDVIIANPPYGAFFTAENKKILKQQYPEVPDYESFYYFISLANTISHNETTLCYIIPNTFMFNLYATSFRKKLLERWNINQILDFTNHEVFSAVVQNCVIFLDKSRRQSLTQLNKSRIIDGNVSHIDTHSIGRESLIKKAENWQQFLSGNQKLDLIDKLKGNFPHLGDFTEVKQGYIPYRKKTLVKRFGEIEGNEILKKKLWHSNKKGSKDHQKNLKGKDIKRYKIEWTGGYIKYGTWLSTYIDPRFFKGARVLFREIITKPPYSIIAAYTKEELYHNPSIIVAKPKDDRIDAKYILAIANSKLASFFFTMSAPKMNKGLFPKILINDVRNIPIAEPDAAVRKQIEALVDKIHAANQSDPAADVSPLEAQIDKIIYKLYNLTKDEIYLIEEAIPKGG